MVICGWHPALWGLENLITLNVCSYIPRCLISTTNLTIAHEWTTTCIHKHSNNLLYIAMQILTVLVVRPYCELHVLCVVDASASADARHKRFGCRSGTNELDIHVTLQQEKNNIIKVIDPWMQSAQQNGLSFFIYLRYCSRLPVHAHPTSGICLQFTRFKIFKTGIIMNVPVAFNRQPAHKLTKLCRKIAMFYFKNLWISLHSRITFVLFSHRSR